MDRIKENQKMVLNKILELEEITPYTINSVILNSEKYINTIRLSWRGPNSWGRDFLQIFLNIGFYAAANTGSTYWGNNGYIDANLKLKKDLKEEVTRFDRLGYIDIDSLYSYSKNDVEKREKIRDVLNSL